MEGWLWVLCAVLAAAVCLLLGKIWSLHRTLDALCREVSARLEEDSNVGLSLSSADRYMRRLATELDRQLKLLRRERLRCRQGDRELKEAVANLSHDLRTPLTAVAGYLELLRTTQVPPEARRYLSVLENRTQAMKELTEELFCYSLVLSGGQYEQREPVDLRQAVEDCVAGYYGVLKENGIVPEISLPDARVEGLLNKAALSRVLENVMSNAVKHGGENLCIVLTEDGRLTFSNRTREMNRVDVARLFDRFYTVEAGRRSTGLGLSIARQLTEQLGGQISASLEGDRFSVKICLPVQPTVPAKNVKMSR